MKKSAKFIPHAIERMKKRGITDKIVLDTLKFSERIDAGRGGRKIAQKMFGDKLLGVIYEEDVEKYG